MRVSVTEAKGQLTELVKRAEAGDEVILTRRGHEVARLVPEIGHLGGGATQVGEQVGGGDEVVPGELAPVGEPVAAQPVGGQKLIGDLKNNKIERIEVFDRGSEEVTNLIRSTVRPSGQVHFINKFGSRLSYSVLLDLLKKSSIRTNGV